MSYPNRVSSSNKIKYLVISLTVIIIGLFTLAAILFSHSLPAILATRTVLSAQDGMTLVYIPAGVFGMGERNSTGDNPWHFINLDGYWIDQTDVTNAMYARCVQAGACKFTVSKAVTPLHFYNPAYANHPVVYVTWEEALEYCHWAGRRLPTEAEWEKAARGTDGRKYPWGDLPPDLSLLNYYDNVGDTTPVGSYPLGASPYGVLDMAGNVRQWIADWFSPNYYNKNRSTNPDGPNSGDKRVLRGGAFDDGRNAVSVYTRLDHDPASPGFNRGFRCANSP